jgi:hypothetical protein
MWEFSGVLGLVGWLLSRRWARDVAYGVAGVIVWVAMVVSIARVDLLMVVLQAMNAVLLILAWWRFR